MKIEVKGYKNINTLSYDIDDNKTNVLVGVSGSGKSSIVSALLNDDFEFNKNVTFTGIVSATLNGKILKAEELSIFSESTLDRYLFEESKEDNIFNVLIDDDNEYMKSREKLNKFLSNITQEIQKTDQLYSNYIALQSQLGGKLTSNNNLRASSAIKKMRKSIEALSKKRLYNKLSKMDSGLVSWRIKGEQFILNSKCPYCEKILSKNREKELHEYKNIDISSYGKVSLSPNQLSLISAPRVILTETGMEKLETEIVSIGVAIKEYEKLKADIDSLFDTDLNIKKIPLFKYSSELYLHFPTLKKECTKIEKQLIKLTSTVKEAQSKTKRILNRKLNYINNLLKSFGVPYKIEAKYKQSRIDKYKLFHINDASKTERIKGLSTGERKIVSLIFFILEQKLKKNKLIVFDDPVSSYDENRRFSIFRYLIDNLNKKTCLILSHEQSFAKYASFSKKQNIGRVDYFFNDLSSINIIPITKSDFDNISNYIIDKVKRSSNYIQKIINLRYYYEINRKYPEYSYLSAIIHKDNMATWFKKKKHTESQILNKINQRLGINLVPFNIGYYSNINTTSFCDIEKIFLLREKVADKTLKNEISNYVHLNTTYVVSLNPYKFSFCSNYLINAINLIISSSYNM